MAHNDDLNHSDAEPDAAETLIMPEPEPEPASESMPMPKPKRRRTLKRLRVPGFERQVGDMIVETTAQFDGYRSMREKAQAIIDAGADELAEKVARIDIRTAVDGMNMSVRSLEKLEALARTLRLESEKASAEKEGDETYETARDQLIAMVEARAHHLAIGLAEAMIRRQNLAPPDAGPPVQDAHKDAAT